MNQFSEGHIVKSYDEELSEISALVDRMAELASSQIVDAVESLGNKDVEAALTTIEQDQEIDRLELAIDQRIVHLIAKRQPMACDLREVMAVSRIVSDLERIGDQARRVARLTLHFYSGDLPPPNRQLLVDIPKLSSLVDEMVRRAISAFDNTDPAEALQVMRMDDRLDDEMKSALRRLSTYLMEDARSVGHVVEITLCLRALERIGGHAKYIARHTIFLVEGKDVRHESPEQVAAVLGY